ncbi:MAG: GxxExxY protein [Bacteroidetes bacterium]|nr:MAG: GxxExxY protein [Bacteroidota bacterium]
MPDLLYQDETYKIIGICFDVHNQLGPGFSEIVYKDALEYEFRTQNIYFEREVEYSVFYKTVVLPHKFYADFVVFEHIILEVKGIQRLAREHIAQTINYLKVSGNDVGLLVNFGEPKLTYKRLVL